TQTHLYWTETAYPDPGTIRRLPLAGGPAEIVYISPIPLARVLATDTVGSGRLLFVDGGMPHSHRLKALPLAGGAPVELALLPAAPRRLAADGTHVCWIDAEAVYGIPAGGGAPVPIAAGPLGLTDLTLDGGDAFWTEYPGEAHGITGNVSKAPLDGGAVTVLAADVRSPAAVAVAGTDVYWSQAGPLAAIEHFAMIGSVPRDGGTIGVFAAGITALHAPVVADNQGIYVADGWTVKRLGFGPSAAQVLATTDDAVAGIALHDGTLVWIGGPFGIVFSVPTVGGTVSLLGAVNGYAGAVALDAAAAYAVGGLNEIHRFPRTGAGGGLLTSSGIVDALLPAAGETLCYADLAQNALYRIPTTGGTATWLAGILNSDWSCRLATDGPSLYWITPSMAAQVPVAGGNSTTLLQNLPADPGMVLPNSIAVDADGVYCAVVLGDGTGAILRIPRE
ncbi:MAG: hypothetical protein JXR77_06095, partial [Lentisphaeria bacterium]|nr:hypothetical protein [Lentisphaeria bacterium]